MLRRSTLGIRTRPHARRLETPPALSQVRTVLFLAVTCGLFVMCWWAKPAVGLTSWANELSYETQLIIAALPSAVLLFFGVLFACILPAVNEPPECAETSEMDSFLNGHHKTYDACEFEMEATEGDVSDELAFGKESFKIAQKDAVLQAGEDHGGDREVST